MRPSRHRIAAVAVGGAAGATLRWAVLTTTTNPGSFPWPVFAVNIVGSLLLGVLLAEEWTHPTVRLALHDGAGIGFCGGLTTFSTFAVEIVELADAGHLATAAAYAVTSVLAAIAAVVVGAACVGQVRALTLPVEGEP